MANITGQEKFSPGLFDIAQDINGGLPLRLNTHSGSLASHSKPEVATVRLTACALTGIRVRLCQRRAAGR